MKQKANTILSCIRLSFSLFNTILLGYIKMGCCIVAFGYVVKWAINIIQQAN